MVPSCTVWFFHACASVVSLSDALSFRQYQKKRKDFWEQIDAANGCSNAGRRCKKKVRHLMQAPPPPPPPPPLPKTFRNSRLHHLADEKKTSVVACVLSIARVVTLSLSMAPPFFVFAMGKQATAVAAGSARE
jgi:hypothetical protein